MKRKALTGRGKIDVVRALPEENPGGVTIMILRFNPGGVPIMRSTVS